jgi:hypothetical protein
MQSKSAKNKGGKESVEGKRDTQERATMFYGIDVSRRMEVRMMSRRTKQ